MKSPFQDIIPSEKRSIRNISIGEIKSKEREESAESAHVRGTEIKSRKRKVVHDDAPLDKNIVFKGKKTHGASSLVLWGISLACLFTAFFTLTHFLSAATINIEAKSFQVPLPSKLPLSLQPADGEVGYSTVTLSDSISDTIPATGQKDVSTKSTGTLIVYNNYNSSTQKLVSGTRFASSKGLIYKLDKTVVVPGIKKVSGKNVPGSIEVSVTADVPGKDYNIDLDDFTIPGFKGTPKFDKIYARSKTPMTGGTVGKIATVSDSDLSKKVAELKVKLDLKLKDKASKELPGNQVAFSNLSNTTYVTSDPVFEDSKAVVTVTENKKVYLIDGNTFAKALISPQGANVLPGDEFLFGLDNADATFTGSTTDASAIGFDGKITVTYKLDVDKFKKSIAGIGSVDVPSVALKFPSISKISTTIKPFWKSSVPEDLDRITVNVN